jgi:acetylornithine deacetylase
MHPLHHHLAELVRRPSVNPMGRTDLPAELIHESRVTDYWEERFRELGVRYERIEVQPGRCNILAHYEPSAPAPCHLLFEAHQDTVPVDGMIVEPFAAKIEQGRLYGRGACDVKAGGVAMFGAFERLVREKPAGSAAVTLAFTIDEEHTFLGIQHLMKSGFKADFAVVAEPTQLNIVRSHKGVVRWGIETHGVACHSSRPEKGVNAVYRMAKVLNAVEAYSKQLQASRYDPLLGSPTMCVGMVRGGASPNTVPDHCSISIDRRLLPGETAWEAIADLTEFLRQHPGIVEYHVTDPSFACPALVPKGGEAFVDRLGRIIDSVKGSHTIDAVPYGTDASTVQEAGIPAVVFGPGDIAQAHTKDEWVELAQVEQAADVLFQFATV